MQVVGYVCSGINYVEGKYIFLRTFLQRTISSYTSRNVPNTFFNRSKELQAMETILKRNPQFSIITGPVHSGKSVLLSQVMDNIRHSRQS